MNVRDLDGLELISRLPRNGAAFRHPLLFVHGAFTGAWCWDEHFLDYFADCGFAAHALSLSGHGGSPERHLLDHYSIADYVGDVSRVAGLLGASPILIGHSMGGLVVQKYLERATAPAAVLVCSVPPQGLMSSAFGLAMRNPGLLNDLNGLLAGGRVNPEGLRSALFYQPVAEHDLLRYLACSQRESHRAIWDMTMFNLPNPWLVAKVPMLILGAAQDALIPPQLVEMTALSYQVPARIMPDLGHGVMLEAGWRDVAVAIREWLERTLL